MKFSEMNKRLRLDGEIWFPVLTYTDSQSTTGENERVPIGAFHDLIKTYTNVKIPYLDQMRPTINESNPLTPQKANRFPNRVDDRLQWLANSSEISRFRNNIPPRQGECIFRFMDSNATEMGIVHIPNAGVNNGFIIPVSSISSRVIGSAFDLGLFEYTKELTAGSTEFKYVGKAEQLVVIHGHFEFFVRARSIPKFFEPDPFN